MEGRPSIKWLQEYPDTVYVKKYNIIFFIFWFLAVSIPISYLTGYHTFAMEKEPLSDLKKIEILKSKEGRWKVAHLMSGQCGCSKRVMKYLASRKAISDRNEVVVLIDGTDELKEKMKVTGFDVVSLNGEEAFDKYHITSVPQMVVFDEKGEIKYSGGYSSSRTSPYEDQQIYENLKAGKTVEELPLFGCMNGQKITKKIDPLGLKYGGLYE